MSSYISYTLHCCPTSSKTSFLSTFVRGGTQTSDNDLSVKSTTGSTTLQEPEDTGSFADDSPSIGDECHEEDGIFAGDCDDGYRSEAETNSMLSVQDDLKNNTKNSESSLQDGNVGDGSSQCNLREENGSDDTSQEYSLTPYSRRYVLWLAMTRPKNAGRLSLNELCSKKGKQLIPHEQHRRDEAQAVAYELLLVDMEVHTVSLQDGSEEFHLNCDISSKDFVDKLREKFGDKIDFERDGYEEIVLDYYWMPSGEWQDSRFGATFFRENITALFSTLAKDSCQTYGTIFLPFTIWSLYNVWKNMDLINEHYITTALCMERSTNLSLVWGSRETKEEDPDGKWLGKPSDQEHLYLGVRELEIRQRVPETLGKELLTFYNNRISNPEEAKFLQLEPKRISVIR